MKKQKTNALNKANKASKNIDRATRKKEKIDRLLVKRVEKDKFNTAITLISLMCSIGSFLLDHHQALWPVV